MISFISFWTKFRVPFRCCYYWLYFVFIKFSLLTYDTSRLSVYICLCIYEARARVSERATNTHSLAANACVCGYFVLYFTRCVLCIPKTNDEQHDYKCNWLIISMRDFMCLWAFELLLLFFFALLFLFLFSLTIALGHTDVVSVSRCDGAAGMCVCGYTLRAYWILFLSLV